MDFDYLNKTLLSYLTEVLFRFSRVGTADGIPMALRVGHIPKTGK